MLWLKLKEATKRLTKHHRINREQQNRQGSLTCLPSAADCAHRQAHTLPVPRGDDSHWTLEINAHYLWIFLCWSRGKLHTLYCAQNNCQQ